MTKAQRQAQCEWDATPVSDADNPLKPETKVQTLADIRRILAGYPYRERRFPDGSQNSFNTQRLFLCAARYIFFHRTWDAWGTYDTTTIECGTYRDGLCYPDGQAETDKAHGKRYEQYGPNGTCGWWWWDLDEAEAHRMFLAAESTKES